MMKDLMKQLSLESADQVAEKAEEVLQTGQLLDGTSVDGNKESAIKEMIEHADRARLMSDQLTELADKADAILEEDNEHLINEISTEAYQMCYRHIMQTAGLSDALVSFESTNKSVEMNYLSTEARKMANVAETLENRILDLSPEGKIWSFIRADSKRMAVARGDIESYGEKIIRRAKDSSISSVPVEWTLLGNAKEWLVFKNGKAVSDLTAAVIEDLELLNKSFETVQQNNKLIRQIVGDVRSGKDLDKNKLKQIKTPEIVGKHILGDKLVKPSSSEISRIFGWTPANPPAWAIGLTFLFLTPLTAPLIIIGQKINAKNALESSNTHIDPNKVKRMLELFRSAGKILDRDEHADFDLDSIDKEIPGEQKKFLKDIAKQSARTQGFLYEHMFFLTWGMAETMRGLNGSWDLFLGQAQV